MPECCCSRELSRDEQALLGLLCHAPEAGEPFTAAAIPHGLPGAIRWAAYATRRALGTEFDPDPEPRGAGAPPRSCPFNPALRVAEGVH